MHSIRKAPGPLLSLRLAIQDVLRGLLVDINPPEPNLFSLFFFLDPSFCLRGLLSSTSLQVSIKLHDLNSEFSMYI